MMARRFNQLLVPALLLAFAAGSADAQTRIVLRDNKYTPQQDVQLGQEAASEVRREYPMLNDSTTERLVDRIGQRLAENIPAAYRQPAFRYSFDVVNMKEINAFALPGGPMFVNRGMIEASRTEAEVAGVMAHEIAHVVLRHGTVQASKAQKFQIGAIAGQILGAIVGGNTGSVIAQGSEFGLGAYFLKYGREFEREADLLGAQILAQAGYDPIAMATMFETIAKQGGGSGGPEWLSSHPNPGNRSAAIRKEAQSLPRATYAGNTTEFNSVRSRLGQMSAAPTAQQVAQARKQGQRIPGANTGGNTGDRGSVGTSGRAANVEPPSTRYRAYQPAEAIRVQVPENWQQIGGEGLVTYAPEGGYTQEAFTHGVQFGVAPSNGQNLQQSTNALIQSFGQANPNLRRSGNNARTTLGGRAGLGATLVNTTPYGDQEVIILATTTLSDGSTLFMIGVAPQREASTYQGVFNRVRQGLTINDR
ncbi:MAG: M48 family metallopeptidase [Acidobacteriota bacterium]|nr:M48 family metallopeptidase [Acidobacteriota bacterium]